MKVTPIPTGTKDILPREAAELRYLEAQIRQVFKSFGYGEVITPTVELETALEQAAEQSFKKSFRLFDEQGNVLVMRPEMTTPIARLVATKLADRQPPFRLSYFANSFQPTQPQRGRQSEYYQAGLELIGLDSPAVDAEVLAVLCQVLAGSGLSDFAVGLGEASFFKALLDSLAVSDEQRGVIFAALVDRDLVELGQVVESLPLSAEDKEAILSVTTLRGGSEVLTQAQDYVRSPAMEAALKRLARTYYLVSRYGYARHILFDLGIFRNFDYYTGIVFEVYSGDLGFPIGGGGRYNGLLAKYGRQLPAVGFALGLDRLHIAVTDQGGLTAAEAPAVVLVEGEEPSLQLAGQLRQNGIVVFTLPAGTDESAAREIAADNNFSHIVLPQDQNLKLIELAGETVSLAADELLERLTS